MDKTLILREIKTHLGYKKEIEFADFLEIKPQTLNSWYTRNSFDYEVLYAKCEKWINPHWLLTGEGEMLKDSDVSGVAEASGTYNIKTDNNVKIQAIPLYSLEAAAGIVQLFRDSIPTKEYITVPNLPRCDGAIYINGDSMYPLLKSGDIVMYKQVQDIKNYTFIWGQMYLINFQTDGEDYTAVKYIQKNPDNTLINLVSQNDNHQTIELDKTRIRALALIKASIRINTMN